MASYESVNPLFLETPKPQTLLLPRTILSHVFRRLTPETYQKLYRTCKLFYPKFGFNFINDLTLSYNSATICYRDKVLKLSKESPYLDRLVDLWLYGKTFVISVDQRFLSYFMSQVCQCSLTELELNFQKINVQDFEFLTESKTLERINLFDVKVMDTLGRELLIEDVLKKVAHANFISVCPCHATAQTSARLAVIKNNQNIRGLRLLDVNRILQPKLFCDFLKHCCSPQAKVIFNNSSVNDQAKAMFQTEVHRILTSVEPHPQILFFHPNYDF